MHAKKIMIVLSEEGTEKQQEAKGSVQRNYEQMLWRSRGDRTNKALCLFV